MPTAILVFSVAVFLIYIYFRYRILTKYSRLPPVSHPPNVTVKPGFASFDLHPDTALDSDDGHDLRGYPDEFMGAFLSSIKVFGYLDRPVFHELARHLQVFIHFKCFFFFLLQFHSIHHNNFNL